MKDTKHEILNEYVGRLKKEALLKAFLSALAVGFGALLAMSIICWFTEFGGYWIYPVAFAVPFGAAMPLFYFFVFYPSEKYVAKRLDQLGLDERILTMVEFGDQDSYIMKRQREDAVATLSKFNSKLVKFALSAALIAVPAVVVPAATAMTTVDALSKAEVIDSGKDLIAKLNEDKTKFDLVYKISDTQQGFGVLYSASNPDGGEEIKLTVGRGQDGEAVMPVAAKGYVFRGWSDGVGSVIRQDTAVQGKIVVTAIFEELDLAFTDNRASDEDLPRELSKDGDSSNPSDPAPPSDKEGSNDPNDPTNPALYQSQQYVFDGQTDYGGAPYQDAYDTAMGELNESGGADGDSKGIASDYFDAIKN